MQGRYKASKSQLEFWLLKALTHLVDLRIYHGQDVGVTKAVNVLLPGFFQIPLIRLGSDKEHLLHLMRALRIGVRRQAVEAYALGKSLRAHLEDIVRYRGAGQHDVTHLIAILGDHVAMHMQETAACQEACTAWNGVERLYPDTGSKLVTLDAVVIAACLDHISFRDPAPAVITLAAHLMKLQIQVHKHIASVLKQSLPAFIKATWKRSGVYTRQPIVWTFYEAICTAAESITVDVAMAKRSHVSMCIMGVLGTDALAEDRYTVLLDRLMNIGSMNAASSPIVKAISQIQPGVQERVLWLHEWPYAFLKDPTPLSQVLGLIRNNERQFARKASDQGIPPEEHLCNMLLAVPGPATADSSAGSRQQPSRAEGGASAGSGSCKTAESTLSSDRAADVAADVGQGAQSKRPASQGGQSMPVQDGQEPKNDKTTAEKVEKKKAKKARQRAARAQASAQTAEAEETGSMDPGPAEGISSKAKLEDSAETPTAEQTPEAGHMISDPVCDDTNIPLAPQEPARSSEATASSRSSSLSPQPSLQLHNGMSHGQLDPDLPGLGALAQAADSAAQEEQPWQEVRTSRRKPVSQEAASKVGSCKTPKQGRGSPIGRAPTLASPECQTAMQESKEALLEPEKAAKVHLHTQPQHVAAEQLPHWLPALAGNKPQKPSQHAGLAPPQSIRPQPLPSKYETVQPGSSSSDPDEACMGFKDMPHPGFSSGTPSPEQSPTAALFKQEEDGRDEDHLCIVCWEELREVIFYHCMHMCTCQGCARDIMAAGALCPMCRASIQSTIKARF
ncbi:g5529 [Coccomyxa viridis]|uniref:G5529 protein n=1 Tax=Coccomyxa viridis TaxID=1274662 RepID=A0ABP1FVK8_9CHLO